MAPPPSAPARDRYAVIGHPIAHSRSPAIHAHFAAATAQALDYGRIDAAPGAFVAAVRAFFEGGGYGLNITVPHKEAAARLADQLTERARAAGAVNTLARRADGTLLGDNTDGVGLMADLARLGVEVRGARVLVLGAGGAARGILGPLTEAAPARLLVANRTAARATALAARFTTVQGCGYDGIVEGPFDLVIHATSLGLQGAVPALPAGLFGAGSIAYDLGYSATDTPFLRWARTQGVTRAEQGYGMLIEQAAAAFRLWRGIHPDTAALHRLGPSATEPRSSTEPR